MSDEIGNMKEYVVEKDDEKHQEHLKKDEKYRKMFVGAGQKGQDTKPTIRGGTRKRNGLKKVRIVADLQFRL